MRLQLIALALLTSFNTFAVSTQEMKDLFENYSLVMDNKKVELIDEVFSKKFLADSGGKAEFIEKLKELPKAPERFTAPDVSWKAGTKPDVFFVRVMEKKTGKAKQMVGSQFMVVLEDGKPKIEKTLSDGH